MSTRTKEYMRLWLQKKDLLEELKDQLRIKHGNEIFNEPEPRAVLPSPLVKDSETQNRLSDTELDFVLDALRETISRIIKPLLIEFITFNFYHLLRFDMNQVLKREVKTFCEELQLRMNTRAAKKIQPHLDTIDQEVRKFMREKSSYYCVHYRYILHRDMEILKFSLIEHIEKEFTSRLSRAVRMQETMKEEYDKDIIGIKKRQDEMRVNECFLTCICYYICGFFCKCIRCILESIYMILLCCCDLNCLGFVSKLCCVQVFCKNLVFKRDFKPKYNNFYNLAKIDGTFYNRTLKSYVGYIFALLFITVFYHYLRYQHESEAVQGTLTVGIIGFFLIFGLAFFPKFRAITALMVPFFASAQGQLLLSYLCYEVLTNNVFSNIETNSKRVEHAYVCTRKVFVDQIDKFSQMDSYLKYVFLAIKSLGTLAVSIKNINQIYKRFLSEITATMKQAVDAIVNYFKTCDNDLLAMFKDCAKMLDDMYAGCKAKFSTTGVYWCWSVYTGTPLCLLSLIVSVACVAIKVIFGKIFSIFKSSVKYVWDKIITQRFGSLENALWFKLNASREYEYYEYYDNSLGEFTANVLEDLYRRYLYVRSLLDELNYIFPIAILVVVISSWWYLKRYLMFVNYDNYTIGVRFREIDMQRGRFGKRTVYPLNRYFSQEFVDLCSLKQTKAELKGTKWALVYFLLCTIPIGWAMAEDQFYIWLNNWVVKHTAVRVTFGHPYGVQLKIDGEGFMAKIYRALFGAFSAMANSNITVDTYPCLKESNPYSYHGYIQLAIYLCIMCFMSLFKSYIKRSRSVIAGAVYPERDYERALWLYNHLIVKSASATSMIAALLGFNRITRACMTLASYFVDRQELYLVKAAINKLCGIVGHIFRCLICLPFNLIYMLCCCCCCCCYCFGFFASSMTFQQVCLKCEQKLARISNAIISVFFTKIYCKVCSEPLQTKRERVHCPNRLCEGLYCQDCYDELTECCQFCNLPIKFDMSEMPDDSFEEDSSEDETGIRNKNDDLEEGALLCVNYNDKDELEEKLDYSYQGIKVSEGLEPDDVRGILKKLNVAKSKKLKIHRTKMRRELVSNMILKKIGKASERAKDASKVTFKISPKKKKMVTKIELMELSKKLDQHVRMDLLRSTDEYESLVNIFNEDYDFYDEIALTCFSTIVNRIDLKEYFTRNDLDTRQFYKDLKEIDINDEFSVFMAPAQNSYQESFLHEEPTDDEMSEKQEISDDENGEP